MSSVSTVSAASLTWVGKPAPPTPTRPQAWIAASSPALSLTTGGTQAGSTVCFPSALMATAVAMTPLTMRMGATSSTVPDTLACTLALTKPPALPISVPTRTVSPFLTTGSAGAPMCISMGMITCSGTGILTVGCAAVPFSWGTAAPFAERFRNLSIGFPRFSIFGAAPRQEAGTRDTERLSAPCMGRPLPPCATGRRKGSVPGNFQIHSSYFTILNPQVKFWSVQSNAFFASFSFGKSPLHPPPEPAGRAFLYKGQAGGPRPGKRRTAPCAGDGLPKGPWPPYSSTSCRRSKARI